MFNQLKLPYLIESSIILALGYIVYRLLLDSDKAYIRNRIYLLSLLLLSFLLPLISLPVYARKVIAVPLKVMDVMASTSSQNVIVESSFDWSIIGPVIYLGVVAMLFFRLLYHILYIRSVINNSQSKTIDGVRHVITDKLTTPASIFSILLTDNSDLPQAVIDHEKVHMRHGHTWDVLIMELAKIILWFNPFIYLTSRVLKDNHEFVADHLASKSVKDELEYSSLLLQYAKTIKTPILLNTFSTITKKRIIMLNKETSNNPWKGLLVLPIFLGIFSIFSCDSYNVPVDPNGNQLTDDMSEIRLDTIIETDSETFEESMTIERVYVNDIRTWVDTTVVFNFETMEEKVQVVRSEGPRTEVLLSTYITSEYNNETGDLETNKYHIYPQEMVESVDTMVTFDYDTFEETVQVVKGERPRQELVSTKVTPKDKINKKQKFNKTFEMKNKVITQSDTIKHKSKGNK